MWGYMTYNRNGFLFGMGFVVKVRTNGCVILQEIPIIMLEQPHEILEFHLMVMGSCYTLLACAHVCWCTHACADWPTDYPLICTVITVIQSNNYRIVVVIRAPWVCSGAPSSGHLSFWNPVWCYEKTHLDCSAPPIFLKSNIIYLCAYHRENTV